MYKSSDLCEGDISLSNGEAFFLLCPSSVHLPDVCLIEKVSSLIDRHKVLQRIPSDDRLSTLFEHGELAPVHQFPHGVPLCPPKYLKGEEYIIEFDENNRAKVCVGELQILVDYSEKKCSNNKSLKCFGSDDWGQDVQIEWSEV